MGHEGNYKTVGGWWLVVGGEWLVVGGQRNVRNILVLHTTPDAQNLRTYRVITAKLPEIRVARDVRSHRFMKMTSSFRDLEVWQESMTLVEEIYVLSKRFPPEERFGLTSQLRRAAVSIPSNIGEGARRKRRKAFVNHLDIALGSQGEVDVQLELAARLAFCTQSERSVIQQRVERIGRMLNGLIASQQPEAWDEAE